MSNYIPFVDVLCDNTRFATKIEKTEYLETGDYIIIDQGKNDIAGYYNDKQGLYRDVPAIIFGDHTRVIKYVDQPCYIGADGVKLLGLTTKCKDSFDYKFLYYFLSNQNIPDTGYNRHFKWLKEVNILNIPLSRQKKNAKILDKASKLIEKRKEQLRELDILAESVFYNMFGNPVTNTKGWNVSSLKSLTTKIGSGATPKGGNENYINEGISLIRSLNVHNAKFKYKDLAFIDEVQARALDGVTVKQNDILLNITGASVARCCIVPNNILPARVNQHVAILRVKNDRLNHKFLCNVLISNEYQNKLLKNSKSNGATREALTKSNLEDLVIITPPLQLQQQFASIIEKIEKHKAKVKEALKKSEDLFQRLMQDMFNPQRNEK